PPVIHRRTRHRIHQSVPSLRTIVGAGSPAKGPAQATHIQMKNKSSIWACGAIGYAIRDIWR
ncbi:hypothetical protein, partial [Pseudomonas putida]|uniref:hypothetical protein n=1 Tax=Pseudomonas putida TaxID=303 RepID=UPI001CA5CC6B